MRIALSFVLALALGSAAGAQAQAPSTANASAPTKAGKPARALKASKPKPKPEVEAPEPESLEEERMAVAPMVLIGDSQCEFGQRISLRPHPTLAGRFLLEHRGLKHVLTPLPTTTGVVRLEERHRHGVAAGAGQVHADGRQEGPARGRQLHASHAGAGAPGGIDGIAVSFGYTRALC